MLSSDMLRPLKNAQFCSSSSLRPVGPTPRREGSNFDPQNTKCIPACPVGPEDRTGWLIRQSSVADSPSLRGVGPTGRRLELEQN